MVTGSNGASPEVNPHSSARSRSAAKFSTAADTATTPRSNHMIT